VQTKYQFEDDLAAQPLGEAYLVQACSVRAKYQLEDDLAAQPLGEACLVQAR
jgi:hypothetical protein